MNNQNQIKTNSNQQRKSFLYNLRFLLPGLAFMLVFQINTLAQSDVAFYGYVKELSMYYHPVEPLPVTATKTLDYLFLNQIHNRLNFKWYANSKLTLALEARNRVFFGQMVREFPGYGDYVDTDNGYIDLQTVLITQNSWFLHTMLDRAWIDYTSGKWQVRAGRQRINWETNLVWNPNDVFNTFSYFDFDYEERPGTDGLRIQYYSSVTSSAELVYKLGRNSNETAIAGMYRFLKSSYDIQFLGGWVGKDYVFGGGWSGDIKGAGFRGEATWFKPRDKNDSNNFESLVASVSADYTFTNSLYLHFATLYNSHGTTGDAGGRSFFAPDISAKMLSYGKYQLFAQTSFPFTPLLTADLSAMLNPCDGSSFIGPSLAYSIGDNWEVMLNGQLFFGKDGTEYGDYGQAIFGRIKWAF